MEDGLGTLTTVLWGANSAWARVVILSIAFVMARAWWKTGKARRALAAEENWIEKAEADLTTLERGASDEGPLLLEPDDLRQEAGRDSLIQQRIEAISELRRRRVRVSLPVLRSLTEAQLEARGGLQSAGRAAQICLLLGILGTFLGLAVMVQEIQLALPEEGAWTVESWTRSIENVSSVMGGIKTAFTTSLVGLVAALLLRVRDHRLEDRLSSVLFRLEYLTLRRLLPLLAPSLDDRSALDQLSRRMEEAHEALERAMEENAAQLGELNGIQGAFLDILDHLRSWSREGTEKELVEIKSEMVQTNLSVLQVAEQLPRAVDAIETSQRRFLDRLSPARTIFTGLGQLWTGRVLGMPGSFLMILLLLGTVVYLTWNF